MLGLRDRNGLDETCWQRLVARAAALVLRGPKGDLQVFVEAVAWILRTGAPWRDLAEKYGRWDRVYRRYRRWAIAGRWDNLRRAVSSRVRREREGMLLIDSTIVKAFRRIATRDDKTSSSYAGFVAAAAALVALTGWPR